MLPRRISSAEEARQHYQQVISSYRDLQLTEFETGWVIREIPSEQEFAQGRDLGQGISIVDRETGAVTSHSSQPWTLSAKQYTAARQTGALAGRQIWPWTAPETRSMVEAIRQEGNRRTLEVTELAEDLWMVTPQPMPDEPTHSEVSYAADGQKLTIWEYPSTTATAYPAQKGAGQISGRLVYPIPT